MGKSQRVEKGELILLGIFGAFMITYLVDIHDLPWEATVLSYILSVFILGLLLALFLSALISLRKTGPRKQDSDRISKTHETKTINKAELGRADKREKNKIETFRLYKSMSMGILLFASIFIFGFYVGSGVMLLIWFLIFRKINLTTITITVATPLLLYVTFRVLMDFGLHEGQLFLWLFS